MALGGRGAGAVPLLPFCASASCFLRSSSFSFFCFCTSASHVPSFCWFGKEVQYGAQYSGCSSGAVLGSEAYVFGNQPREATDLTLQSRCHRRRSDSRAAVERAPGATRALGLKLFIGYLTVKEVQSAAEVPISDNSQSHFPDDEQTPYGALLAEARACGKPPRASWPLRARCTCLVNHFLTCGSGLMHARFP